MHVKSKFTTDTRYPVTSAAYDPSSMTREPAKIHVIGGASFLSFTFRISRYAGMCISFPSFLNSTLRLSDGP